MNKKILISLAMIAAVAAVVVGATTAYFSDVETSTGNTFTAGTIDLTVDSNCTYNGAQSGECGVWSLRDLNPTADKFFNFTDVKPGDYGENTVSLHVENNEAYACLNVSPLVNNDNTCTEPEKIAEGGQTCGTDPGAGELAQNLQFFAWNDLNGNNIWETGESPLFSNIYGPASDVLSGRTYPLGILPGGQTKYIGIYWCAGNITVGTYTLSCDGSAMGNNVQSDSMSADISFDVAQVRNNPNFVCPGLPGLPQ